jgi:hypothetical protein
MKYNRWADFHVHADVIKKPEPEPSLEQTDLTETDNTDAEPDESADTPNIQPPTSLLRKLKGFRYL